MTPKEKAQELVSKYRMYTEFSSVHAAKQCARIAADEIIDAIDWHEYETPNKELNYWLDVRKEIEKI